MAFVRPQKLATLTTTQAFPRHDDIRRGEPAMSGAEHDGKEEASLEEGESDPYNSGDRKSWAVARKLRRLGEGVADIGEGEGGGL